ncbi:MAG: hypothetical protein MK082_00850 [Phycisphaerales bacterium]|nr:hypothetical protein [Phycisphaerales bacterium]
MSGFKPFEELPGRIGLAFNHLDGLGDLFHLALGRLKGEYASGQEHGDREDERTQT